MSGLFRRLSSRRSDGPEGAEPPAQADQGAADAPATAPADPGGPQSLLVDPAAQTRVLPGADQPTTFERPGEVQPPAAGGQEGAQGATADPARTIHPVVRLPATAGEPQTPYGVTPAAPMLPVSDLPAGFDPDELAAAPPTSARRSRLRKRVSFLRAAREVLLRDLGGFVYELHRTAGDIEHEAHRRLREIKLTRLTRLDTELHELELRLDDVRRHVVVREPGVGGECPHCGELFGSDAHYCAHCGLPLTESARRAVAHEAAPPGPAAEPQAAQPHDQPTEEYSPLRAGDPEFRWPQRPAGGDAPASAGETPATPSGGDASAGGEAPGSSDDATTRVIGGSDTAGADTPEGSPGGDVPAGTTDGDAAAGSPDGDAAASAAGGDAAAGTASGDAATGTTGGDAPTGTIGGDAPASADNPTDTAGGAPKSGDAPVGTTGGDAPTGIAGDDAPGSGDALAGGESRAAGTASGGTQGGDKARGADAAATDEGARDASTADRPDEPRAAEGDDAAGRNGSAFSPVERRR